MKFFKSLFGQVVLAVVIGVIVGLVAPDFAAKLKPLLTNAKFVMTQTGWDEAIESARESETMPWRWSMIG